MKKKEIKKELRRVREKKTDELLLELKGGSTAPCLARSPRVPLLMPISIGLEAKGLSDFQGRRGITFVVPWNLRLVVFGVENWSVKDVDPNVLQSGFGVIFLFWPGEFNENCRGISQRISMANFDCEFFGLVFPFQAPQKKVHAQNSRPNLSAFLSNFAFSNPNFHARRFSA